MAASASTDPVRRTAVGVGVALPEVDVKLKWITATRVLVLMEVVVRVSRGRLVASVLMVRIFI